MLEPQQQQVSAALLTFIASMVPAAGLTGTIVFVSTTANNDTAFACMTWGLVLAGCYLLWATKFVTFV